MKCFYAETQQAIYRRWNHLFSLWWWNGWNNMLKTIELQTIHVHLSETIVGRYIKKATSRLNKLALVQVKQYARFPTLSKESTVMPVPFTWQFQGFYSGKEQRKHWLLLCVWERSSTERHSVEEFNRVFNGKYLEGGIK